MDNSIWWHVKGLDDSQMRTYEGKDFKVDAHKNSCFFCKRMTDIFWDYSNGPYLFITDDSCNIMRTPCCGADGADTFVRILRDGCDEFVEEE